VQLSDGKHLNIGFVDCNVGDSIKVKRLDEIFCKCLDESVHGIKYSYRLSKMRREHDVVNSNQNKITDISNETGTSSRNKSTTTKKSSSNQSVESGNNPLDGKMSGNKNGLINGPM
jgi:hypothetical protein